jgi:hypothetical protein
MPFTSTFIFVMLLSRSMYSPRRRARVEHRRDRRIAVQVRLAAVITIVNASAHAGERRAALVTVETMTRIEAGVPNHRFTVASAEKINREDNRRRAGALSALHDLLDDRPILLPVELEPDRPAPRGDGILDRRGRDVREHHQMIFRLRGARRADFAKHIERLLTAHRIDHDRRRVFRSIQRNARIESAQICKTPRTERPALVSLAIGADRRIVIGAGGEISPVSHRDLRFGRGLKIEDVERVLGRFDNRRLRRQLLHGGHRLLGATR